MALARLDHPTDDDKLPSFIHPTLAEATDDLTIAMDCWSGLKGSKDKYLWKEIKEPKRSHELRMMRTSFNSFFRDAVVAFAGVLSRYQLNNAPDSLTKALDNIDGEGNSLRAFLMRADAATLRDGGCLVMADMPPAPEPGSTRTDTQDRRPHLSLIDRRNLVNWYTSWEGGKERIEALSLLEWHEERSGSYGITYVPRYRVMVGGEWKVFKLNGSGRSFTAEVATDDLGRPMEGFFKNAAGDVLASPPVRWYASNGNCFGTGDLPLIQLANFALDHFREYSDLKELLHKTAMPVPVRKGVLGTGPKGSTPPMILGPNSGIDLPADGEFRFEEVTGASLDKHQAHLVHIETLIDRKTLSFLFSGAQKTATQANLESVQMQATLQTIGEAKQSLVQSVMDLWCSFSGETLKDKAGVELAEGIFDEPVTVEKLGLAQKLYDASLLTKRSVLYLEQKLNLLPPGQTIEKELADIEKEMPTPAPQPGVNDLINGLPPDPTVLPGQRQAPAPPAPPSPAAV